MARSKTEIREVLREIRYAISRLDDMPQRKEQAEDHTRQLERLLIRGDGYKGNPNLSANAWMGLTRRAVLMALNTGSEHCPPPAGYLHGTKPWWIARNVEA